MEHTTQSSKRTYIIIGAALAVVAVALGAFLYYIGVSNHTGRFPEHTTINGIQVGGMTADRAKTELRRQVENYTLTILERGGDTTVITAQDIGLTYVDGGEVDRLLEQFDPWHWLFDRFEEHTLISDAAITPDEALAEQTVRGLELFTDYIPVENARVVDDGVQFVVTEPVAGTQLDVHRSVKAILEAIHKGETELDLEGRCLYLAPELLADDPELNALADKLNGYLKACVTLDFGDDRIVAIDADVIRTWIVETPDGMDIDRDLAYDFVKRNMAYKFDTFGLTHTVTTHSGVTIKLKGGDYGWCLARGDTTDLILEAVYAGQTCQVEPQWQYKGKNLGVNDIGGTYVEISISEQMMWCYEDGQLVVATPIVTGNINKGNGTPYGSVWAIDGMKRNAVLGTLDTMGYETPVKYWMPFNGNVGIHDADGWRSSYGGEIYRTNGSHGCINTPEEAAKTIYETVSIGTAVIVYDLSDPETVVVVEEDDTSPGHNIIG